MIGSKGFTYNYHNLIKSQISDVIPQGSILGPLLFSLHINDFPILINKITDVIMLADDTSILITAHSQDELLQRFNHVYNHMPKWFKADWLTFKPTKTQVLKFTSTKLPNVLNLAYADHHLLVVETIKFLGLQMDIKLLGRITFKILLPHEAFILYIKYSFFKACLFCSFSFVIYVIILRYSP